MEASHLVSNRYDLILKAVFRLIIGLINQPPAVGLSSQKEWREKKALSIHDLSESSGVNVATIVAAEHDRRKTRHITKRKLAKALGLKPEEIDW